MAQLLEQCGVTKYEPQVINQLLDLAYNMTCTTLERADNIREHVGKPVLTTAELEPAKKLDPAYMFAMHQQDLQVRAFFISLIRTSFILNALTVCSLQKQLINARNLMKLDDIPHKSMISLPPDARAVALNPSYDVVPVPKINQEE